MKLASASVAVLSQGYNPRLLSPEFLVRNGISPDSWKPTDVLVLPPVARVFYENGVEFLLEETKLLIRAHEPSGLDWGSELPRMTLGFISTLPHVAYTDVGLNFDARVPNGSTRLADRLIVEGPWQNIGTDFRVQGLYFQYRMSDCILNLKINRLVEKQENGGVIESVQFDANFHKEFTPDEHTERRTYITTLTDRHTLFCDLIKRFTGQS